jgi:hypothetical protein
MLGQLATQHMRGWSLSPNFLALIVLRMNSLSPKQIILILVTSGQITSQEMLKFLIIGPQDVLALTPSLKVA